MLSKGQKINERYEIITSIGEGGMANVYLAEDSLLQRQVAIKVLRGDLADNEKFIRRFQREAKSVSDLSHPNIVEVYDVGEEYGKHYIVMEYIDGKTLKQLIQKRGSLTVAEVVDIMTQLTSGLSVAHDAYIIHRDIKPQNIMILDNGMIKITDFGIATSMNATQLTQTNSVMGSVHYLPPEQAAGMTATIKSDIYSLGILMYELLSGSVPFKGDNAVEIALKQMKERIPSIRKQNPLIPQSIENIIIKATAKNPKNRYESVKDMNEDLIHALDKDYENVERHIYQYPESETEELPIKKEVKEKKEIKPLPSNDSKEENSVSKKEKKQNKKKIIISIILGLLLLGMIITLLFFNSKNNVKEIKVPDVSNLTTEEAIEILEEKGFKYVIETKESTDIEEGYVIKTSPSKGSTKRKGSTITIIESSGETSYILEDYTGKNYNAIEEKLKNLGITVKIEKKSVENSEDYIGNEDVIIEQEPAFKEDEEIILEKNKTLILYIPDIINTYPDMVEEEWTLQDVVSFTTQYNIGLKVKDRNGKIIDDYEEYLEIDVIKQSRPADDPIIADITLTITIDIDTKTYSVEAKYKLQGTSSEIADSEIVAENVKNGETIKYTCKEINGYTTLTAPISYTIDGKNGVITCQYKENEAPKDETTSGTETN